jgi:hypothetical protein
MTATNSECLFVALVIQYAMRMRHIDICGFSGSTVFLHIISLRHDFRKRFLNTKCVLIYSTTLVWNIFPSKKNWQRYDKKRLVVSM